MCFLHCFLCHHLGYELFGGTSPTSSAAAKKNCFTNFGFSGTSGGQEILHPTKMSSLLPWRKPELRGFLGDSLTKPPFKVTSAEVAIVCPDCLYSVGYLQGRKITPMTVM